MDYCHRRPRPDLPEKEALNDFELSAAIAVKNLTGFAVDQVDRFDIFSFVDLEEELKRVVFADEIALFARVCAVVIPEICDCDCEHLTVPLSLIVSILYHK